MGMTHVYTEDGVAVPVTAIEVGPCPIISLRTQKRNGYSALQLGFGSRKVKNVTKPVLGTLKEAKLESNPPMIIREIRLEEDSTAAVGDVLKADIFAKDEFVDVTGQTKGRGFAGVVRRW
ncbi:MAG: 50S ribosomal protein L3, partial [Victivallales bacterium]|nr:50S ribosomal protein L3 [Victivallales bacterium]